MKTEDLLHTLEALVDQHGLVHVMETLATICYEKAEHVAASYSDMVTEKAWTHTGNRILALAEKLDV